MNQNILFSGLKRIPLSSKLAKLLKRKTIKPSKHETYHRFSTLDHLTIS